MPRPKNFGSGALLSPTTTTALGRFILNFGHSNYRFTTTRLYSSDVGRNYEIFSTGIWNPVLNDFLAFLFDVDLDITETGLPKLLP